MQIKTIKGISDEKWIKLKMLAVKNKIAMGKLVENMIDNYESHIDKAWNKILYRKEKITDREAEEMYRITKKLRKEKWERDVNS